MNKKLIAIISAAALVVVIIMVATFVACNGNNTPDEEDTSSDNQVVVPGDESDESNDDESNEGNENTGSNPGDLQYVDADGFVFVINPYAPEVPVRSGEFNYLGAVKVGEKLERLGVSSDERWTKIKYNDDVAYVATRNLTTYDKDNNSFVAVDKEIVLTQNTTVRTSPQVPNGTKNSDEEATNAVEWLEKGTTVKVIAEDTELGWYKIECTPTNAPSAPTVEGYTYEFFIKIPDDNEENTEDSSDESDSDESTEETEGENQEPAEAGK